MSPSNNKRNFKRRRSSSIFNIWSRDEHKRKRSALKVKLKQSSSRRRWLNFTWFVKDNDNYKKYGFFLAQQFILKEERMRHSSTSNSDLAQPSHQERWKGDGRKPTKGVYSSQTETSKSRGKELDSFQSTFTFSFEKVEEEISKHLSPLPCASFSSRKGLFSPALQHQQQRQQSHMHLESSISLNWCHSQASYVSEKQEGRILLASHRHDDDDGRTVPSSSTPNLPQEQRDRRSKERTMKEGTELELMSKSIPLRSHPGSGESGTTGKDREEYCQHQDPSNLNPLLLHPTQTHPLSSSLPLPSSCSSNVVGVAGLIRLLSFILRVTCISHYCSKLFFSSTFSQDKTKTRSKTFDLNSTHSTRLLQEEGRREWWSWTKLLSHSLAGTLSKLLLLFPLPFPPSSWSPVWWRRWSRFVVVVLSPASLSTPGVGDGETHPCNRTFSKLSGDHSVSKPKPGGVGFGESAGGEMGRSKTASKNTLNPSSSFFSNNGCAVRLFRKRVRCQISSVRSDLIYIIVGSLVVLLPSVAPVITSNEVYPMDSAPNRELGEAEVAVPVEGVVGKRVDMPCDISSTRRDDSVYMVLWFRGDESIPIYSLDVRGKHFSAAKHWSADAPFGKRGHFQTTSEPARLIVEPVKVDDQSIYRCRVDFRNSPSRETRLNLTIIVPPQEPQIFESTGMNVRGEVGPYREGSTIELTCIVREGHPTPFVLWYLNDNLVDSTSHVENGNQVVNHIVIPNVQRNLHRANLECRAHNTVLIAHVSKTVAIELYLRPLTASIEKRHNQLVTNTQYEIICESWGSHPSPVMNWYLEGQQLTGITTEESRSSNTSVSRLLFSPTPDVDGKRLICRAVNQLLPGATAEDSWLLRVVYSPILSLRLGSSLNPNAIKEGDDVYFECLIRSNPTAIKLAWYHNGELLQHNRSSGVIVSNQSLALQKVSRPSGGNYSCRAINQQGEGTSNIVKLGIMYAPACRSEMSSAEGAPAPVIIAASRSEDVNITCDMDALPETLRFQWAHTNNVGEPVDLAPEIYTSQGSKSFLSYNLRSEEDFGTLLCWAQNSIGTSERPCIYQLVPADVPQSVENCSIINRTSSSVEVTCEAGFDGGLPQSFYLEAYQAAPPDRRGLYYNTSSSSPTFSLSGLDPDGTFHFKIYAVNRKGRSSASIMDNIALHYPAMQSAKVRDLEKTTIAIITGAVSAVVLSVVSLIVFIVQRVRNPINAPEIQKSYSREFRGSRRSSTNDELYHHSLHHNTKKAVNSAMDLPFSASNDVDEDDPDLIPSTRNVKGPMDTGKTTYSRLSNGEINQRYGHGHVEKIPLRTVVDPDVPLTTMEQHSALSNYATFRSNKSNGYGAPGSGGIIIKQTRPILPPLLPSGITAGVPRPIVSSTSGSFHGKPSSVVVNIDTRLIGQQLASNQLPESCV